MVYFISSPGPTQYDYFTRLGVAFLSGHLYLEQNPSWLNELVNVGGRFHVVYPPMPAVLMIPGIWLFGSNFSQTGMAILIGGLDVALVMWLMWRLKQSLATSVIVSLFFGLGTNLWYLSAVGSAWYIAHDVALLFLLLSLIESFGRRRWWLIGLGLGMSFWARTTVIFGGIFFLVNWGSELWPTSRHQLKNLLWLGGGVGIMLILDGGYNWLRFGSISPLSPYLLISGLDHDPMFNQGFMSWQFIPRHLEAMLIKLPLWQTGWPWLIPSIGSLAIWVTSPAVVLAFLAKPSRLMWSCWVAVGLVFGVISLWAGVGYSQFGYRFAQDFMPFLLILMALGIGQRPRWYVYALVGVSVLVNFWGVVMLNYLQIYGW